MVMRRQGVQFTAEFILDISIFASLSDHRMDRFVQMECSDAQKRVFDTVMGSFVMIKWCQCTDLNATGKLILLRTRSIHLV